MTARKCFTGKMAAGDVTERAGKQILDMLDGFEAEHQGRLGDGAGSRQAALDAVALAKAESARRADDIASAAIAQSNVLRAVHAYSQTVDSLRGTPGEFGFGNKAPPTLGKEGQTSLGFAARSLLARDPYEIASWGNVFYRARQIRGEAHAMFAEAIDFLKPKNLGFTPQKANELDVLRALYGDQQVDPQARAVAQAWERTATYLAEQYKGAGGRLTERKDWRLPNPGLDPDKVKALGANGFRALVDQHADRAAMLDFDTGKPLSDARFSQLVDETYALVTARGVEGEATSAAAGRRMLANSRDFNRFFAWKSAESWQAVAEGVGTQASPYETMLQHIGGMSHDTAMIATLGNNPETTKRFILALFDREAARLTQEAKSADPKDIAAATKQNRATVARVAAERKLFENLYAEVSGTNRIPLDTTMARFMGDVRAGLVASQMGSAIISSLTDPVTMAMTARFNGVPASNVLSRATAMMTEPGAEIFAAQQGLVADSIAHAVGTVDQVFSETIRTGAAAKLASATIRASGLRRWSSILRASFGLEMMAHGAREQATAFADLSPQFRSSLERYGIGVDDWKLMQAAVAHEPRPNAKLLRASDIAELEAPAAKSTAEKWSRLINTEMDYAVIEGDPVTRAMIVGESQPGTISGELRRAVGMYRQFPLTFMTMHFARAFARGWDGSRLAHAGLTFSAMTLFGAVAMQAKEVTQGRDPLSLDPSSANGLRAWGKAMLQGGGFGVFGDVLFIDQTKFGNSWAATAGGPIAGAVETVLGDFLLKNIQKAGKGEPTTFAGDALYAAGKFVPGSSLWYARLGFQRGVLDQLALMIDSRAPERFARMEATARKEWSQGYWLPPGRTEPRRAPDFSGVFGR